jgi:hypothetical protein
MAILRTGPQAEGGYGFSCAETHLKASKSEIAGQKSSQDVQEELGDAGDYYYGKNVGQV